VREPVEVSGPTVEDAIDEALRRLGATEDEVEIRIISEGRGPNEAARVYAALRQEKEPEPAADDESDQPPLSRADLDTQADVVEDFINGLLDRMDVDADVDVIIEDETVIAELDGEDSGLLIGRHGATIDAIQEITRAVVKAKTGSWPHVAVDVEGYRARRQSQLEAKARRLADKVKRSGQAADMPPMTAAERKIVHQVLTGMTGVRTESAGQGAERHIVIHPA
jgi:spoIIIJ-associated protein